MPQAYPTHIARNFERKWQLRWNAATVPTCFPVNDNQASGGICPVCHAPAPLTPSRSDYFGSGRVHHHWICAPCGHAWSTAAHVVS